MKVPDSFFASPSAGLRPGWGRSARRWLAALLTLSCASCTDLQLRRYRDDRLLQEYRYALGEQYIEVNGLRICYQEAGHGPDILIIPGLCTSIDFWQQNIPALAEHYHVLAVDPPGSGKSDKPEASYELTWIRDQVRAFMDAKGVAHATVMGASLGGELALMLAMDTPERVDGLVLMGSSGAWPPPGPLLDLAIRLIWNDQLVTDHLRRAWPGIFNDLLNRDTEVTQRLLRYQMAQRASLRTYLPEGVASSRTLRSIFYTHLRPRLGEVRQPALLIWGEHDRIHLPSEARYLREHLPRARLVVIPGAAHQVILNHSETFNRLVMSFLSDGLETIADDDQWARRRGIRFPTLRANPLLPVGPIKGR